MRAAQDHEMEESRAVAGAPACWPQRSGCPLPGGLEPSPDESTSYAQWLGLRPGADSDSGA